METAFPNIVLRFCQGRKEVWIAESYIYEYLKLSKEYMRLCRFRYINYLKRKPNTLEKKNFYLPLSPKGSWRWASLGGGFYYDYYRIPNRKPTRFQSSLPDIEEFEKWAMAPKKFTELPCNIEEKIIQGVQKHFNQKDKQEYILQGISMKKAQQFAQSIAWLRYLKEIMNYKWVHLGYTHKIDVWQKAVDMISKEKLQGLKISNIRTLRRKCTSFNALPSKEAQKKYVLYGYYDNRNHKKINKIQLIHPETAEVLSVDYHLAVLYGLYLNIDRGNKLFISQIYKIYCERCEKDGFHPVSIASVYKYLGRMCFKHLASRERDGKKFSNDRYTPYIASHRLQYGNSLWCLDGSGTKLAYWDRKQKKIKSLYCIRCYDVCSGMLLGYSLCEQENRQSVIECLQMAIEKSKRKMPIEIVCDNGTAFQDKKTKEILSQSCKRLRHIQVGNSQANPAERFIRMTTDDMRDQWNWLATGFVSSFRRINAANPDKMNIDLLPNWEQATLQIEKLFQRYNKRKDQHGIERQQAYQKTLHPESEEMTPLQYRWCFGKRTEVNISRLRGYVVVQKDYKMKYYTIPNYENNLEIINKKTGWKSSAKVEVVFDEKVADLYNLEGEYILSCKATKKSHASIAEASTETKKAFVQLSERKQRFLRKQDHLIEQVRSAQQSLNNKETEIIYELRMLEEEAKTGKKKVKEVYNKDIEKHVMKTFQKKEAKNKAWNDL